MSPKAILALAYRGGLVPVQLHGRTQHKTLQARISEDIVLRRDHSAFFRTAPGRFFLREFLADSSVPQEWRQPISTRRRFRELLRGPALAVNRGDLGRLAEENIPIAPTVIFDLLKNSCRYEDPRRPSDSSAFIRSFVCGGKTSGIRSRIGANSLAYC